MRNLRIAVFIIIFFAVWSAFFVSVASAGEREDSVSNYIAVYTELVTSAHRCHTELLVNGKRGNACGSYMLINDDYRNVHHELYQGDMYRDKSTYNLIAENDDFYWFFEQLEASKIKLNTCVKYINEN